MLNLTASAFHAPGRLAALEHTTLLECRPEAALDCMTALAGKILRAPIAVISLVGKDRQFFKSCLGIPQPWALAREAPLVHSFCEHVVGSKEPLIVSDVHRHPLVVDSRSLTERGVAAYAGVPLTTAEGHAFGSFCAIDHEPRQWTEEEIQILRDMASLAVAEIELRHTTRQLQDDYQHLRNLEALRGDLMHMTVHDLRVPMTSVLVGMETVEMTGELNETQRKILGIASRGGQAVLRLVNDLLDIHKLESESLQLKIQEIDVADLVESALGQVNAMSDTKNITLTTKLEPALPALAADKEKLLRTLVNLLGNAIKFTPLGGAVTVAAQCDRDGDGSDGSILFTVSDTGEGIPPDATTRIFEKFEQVESHYAGHSASTGLGLAFCKLVVEAHGGRIWVESTMGRGSTFRFIVPHAMK